ncbi:16596_t:CDS:2, partial [Racocetra fulgida]
IQDEAEEHGDGSSWDYMAEQVKDLGNLEAPEDFQTITRQDLAKIRRNEERVSNKGSATRAKALKIFKKLERYNKGSVDIKDNKGQFGAGSKILSKANIFQKKRDEGRSAVDYGGNRGIQTEESNRKEKSSFRCKSPEQCITLQIFQDDDDSHSEGEFAQGRMDDKIGYSGHISSYSSEILGNENSIIRVNKEGTRMVVDVIGELEWQSNTDASNMGWGITTKDMKTHGYWTTQELEESIKDAEPGDFQEDSAHISQGETGLVRFEADKSNEMILQQDAGPGSRENRRISTEMGQNEGIREPTMKTDLKSAAGNEKATIEETDSNNTEMAVSALVCRSVTNVYQKSSNTESQKESDDSPEETVEHDKSITMGSRRMANIRKSWEDQGFLEKTIEFDLVSVINFLADMAQTATLNSLKAYRTAISSTRKDLKMSECEEIKRIFKAKQDLDDTPRDKQLPRWEIMDVINSMKAVSEAKSITLRELNKRTLMILAIVLCGDQDLT